MPQNADTLEKDLLENDWDSFCDSSQFHSLIINDKHVSISVFVCFCSYRLDMCSMLCQL